MEGKGTGTHVSDLWIYVHTYQLQFTKDYDSKLSYLRTI